jgi:hypothetical protein
MRHIIEHFEGYVTEVGENTFWGRYEDIAGTEELAEFITEKVLFTDEDKEFLQEGAYFDVIFYSDESMEFNFIKEYWTQEQIDAAHKEAEELVKFFKGLPQDA